MAIFKLLKLVVFKTLQRFLNVLGYRLQRIRETYVPEAFTDDEFDTIGFVKPYTITNIESIYAVIQATKYIVRNDIPGSLVECGVYRGGSMMAIARTLRNLQEEGRDLYLYDTFEGMPQPTQYDKNLYGSDAQEQFRYLKEGSDRSRWQQAFLEEVRKIMELTGYDQELVHYVKGKVEETIPGNCPERIALLRLDTDWYTSTKHELVHLFPLLSTGGVLIIDDYGHWRGCKKAVDEYFEAHNVNMLLQRIDYAGRMGIKT